MKTLNKVIVAILLSIVSIGWVSAQDFKIGLKGGINTSTIGGFKAMWDRMNEIGGGMLDEIGENYSTSYKLGFHAGVVAQCSFGNFFVQPELLFSQIGITEKLDGKTENSSLNYLQIPVYAGYKASVGLGLNLLAGAGPYLAYGISGTDEPFQKNEMFKRFDAGLSFIGGIQFHKIQITLGYDLGLIDMMDASGWKTLKDIAGLSSITNQNIKVSFAYFF